MVLHRLVRIFEKEGSRFFVTRGDSCASEDDPVTSRPNDEVDTVVNLSSVPPKIMVFEELVSPLAKESTGEKDEVSVATPDDDMVMSPDIVWN